MQTAVEGVLRNEHQMSPVRHDFASAVTAVRCFDSFASQLRATSKAFPIQTERYPGGHSDYIASATRRDVASSRLGLPSWLVSIVILILLLVAIDQRFVWVSLAHFISAILSLISAFSKPSAPASSPHRTRYQKCQVSASISSISPFDCD